jgi:hypothetical protein
MQAGDNFSPDIRVDKGLRKLKMFSEDIEFSIASDETNKRDSSVRDVINFGELKFRSSYITINRDRKFALKELFHSHLS